MIPSDDLQKKFDELPDPVLAHLYSERAGELNGWIIEDHDLNEVQEAILFGLLRELFVKAVPLEALLSEVKTRFGFDEMKAKALATDIAGYRLLPLDKWLGDVSGLLRRLGSDPAAYPEDRVQIAERTRSQAADEVAASLAPETDQRLQPRLHSVVESFLAGVRTEAQAKDVLTRPEKIGGVGLEPSVAEHVIEEAKEETRSVVILPEAPEGAAPVAKDRNPDLSLTPEDQAELSKFVVVAPSRSRNLDRLIEELFQASGLAAEDEVLQKRVKMVIGNRLRDIRDQAETLEIMVQPKELGGLSMAQDAARALLDKIQAAMRKNEAELQAQLRAQKAQWVEKERLTQAQHETQDRLGQKAELERLYHSIVAKSPKAQARSGPNAAPEPTVPAGDALALSAKAAVPANLPVASANPVPPAFRPPAPRAAPAVSEVPRPPLPPPATLVKPASVAPRPSAASAPSASRPKLEDIKAVPKLTGPVEELRAITLLDFRRLSRDPKEACFKIKGKIDLLAEQSYARRNEGIAAWMASEVVRTYLELMRDGLNGMPLPQAIAAREAAKKPALTAAEFQAIADLSRQLRY